MGLKCLFNPYAAVEFANLTPAEDFCIRTDVSAAYRHLLIDSKLDKHFAKVLTSDYVTNAEVSLLKSLTRWPLQISTNRFGQFHSWTPKGAISDLLSTASRKSSAT